MGAFFLAARGKGLPPPDDTLKQGPHQEMAYSTRYRSSRSFGSSLPPGVRWLLIVNVALFILNFVMERLDLGAFFLPLKLTPILVVGHGMIWQLVTYMFLHSTSDPFHILFNMLALWMIGAALENTWGTRRFLKYYFVCGVGAGICVIVTALLFGQGSVSTIGASGAIYGLLLAFGLLFPDAIMFLIVFPIKAKYLVMILGALALFFSLSGSQSGISNVAHLGGLLVGFLYLRAPMLQLDAVSLQNRYRKWKLGRAKRKFEVYMRKQDSKREPWVH